MNKIWDALDYLDGGKRWIKGNLYDDDGGRGSCLLGAFSRVGVSWASYDDIGINAVKDIIRDQYPERCNDSGGVPITSTNFPIPNFNDHPDTIFDDVRVVMEKAAIKLDEAI